MLFAVLDRWSESKRSADDAPTEKFHLKDLAHFPLLFWLLLPSCAFGMGSYMAYIGYVTTFFDRYDVDISLSSAWVSIMAGSAALCAPIAGVLYDRFGGRALVISVASGLFSSAMFVLSFQLSYLYQAMLVVLGISYGLMVPAVYSSIVLVIHTENLGTAYGIAVSSYNVITVGEVFSLQA